MALVTNMRYAPDNEYIQVTRISCPSQSPERPIDQHLSIHIGVSTPSATSKQPSEPSKIKIFHLEVIMVFFSTRYKNKPSRDNTDAPTFSEFLAFVVGNFLVLDFHWDWFYVFCQCFLSCTFFPLYCH